MGERKQHNWNETLGFRCLLAAFCDTSLGAANEIHALLLHDVHTSHRDTAWGSCPITKYRPRIINPAPVAQKMRTKIHKESQRPQNPWRRGLNSLPPILR